MDIKLLSPGCCGGDDLETAIEKAISELGIDQTYTKVTDYAEIASYGVLTTPAIVIDDQVKLAGRVPSVEEIQQLITSA